MPKEPKSAKSSIKSQNNLPNKEGGNELNLESKVEFELNLMSKEDLAPNLEKKTVGDSSIPKSSEKIGSTGEKKQVIDQAKIEQEARELEALGAMITGRVAEQAARVVLKAKSKQINQIANQYMDIFRDISDNQMIIEKYEKLNKQASSSKLSPKVSKSIGQSTVKSRTKTIAELKKINEELEQQATKLLEKFKKLTIGYALTVRAWVNKHYLWTKEDEENYVTLFLSEEYDKIFRHFAARYTRARWEQHTLDVAKMAEDLTNDHRALQQSYVTMDTLRRAWTQNKHNKYSLSAYEDAFDAYEKRVDKNIKDLIKWLDMIEDWSAEDEDLAAQWKLQVDKTPFLNMLNERFFGIKDSIIERAKKIDEIIKQNKQNNKKVQLNIEQESPALLKQYNIPKLGDSEPGMQVPSPTHKLSHNIPSGKKPPS